MITIRIKNFQAITEAVLEVSGFTTLVGRSNVGKSSVIRAIQSCITNKPPAGYVRRGTTSAQVQISDGNFTFGWEKGKSVSKYTVNQTTYEKTGRDVPDEITNNGYRQLEVNGQNLDVQIGAQWSPLFILSKSGFLLADLVSGFTGLAVLIDAIQLANADLSSFNKGLNLLKSNLESTTGRLVGFDGIDPFRDIVVGIEGLVETANAKRSALSQLKEYKDKIDVEALVCIHNKSIKLVNIPDVNISTDHINILVDLHNKYHLYHRLSNFCVLDLPEVDLDELLQKQNDRDTLIKVNKEFVSLCYVSDLSAPEVPHVPDDLFDKSTKLDGLRVVNGQLSSLVTTINSLTAELKVIDNQIADTDVELDTLLASMSMCDVCGTIIHDHASN